MWLASHGDCAVVDRLRIDNFQKSRAQATWRPAMTEQDDLKDRYEKLSSDRERLEKALQETQVNFAAIASELEGNAEARMKAEEERDALSREAETLRVVLRKKMREIMIAAVAIIIPGCFAVYLYWLHDAGR